MLLKTKKITLIGMPSSGKSTVGLTLAQKLGFDFLDLDTMVEDREGMSLIDVMNAKGASYFRDMQYEFLKQINSVTNVVISPAGSIILQSDAIEWIRNNTYVVFLDTPFEIIEERIMQTPRAIYGLKERGLKSIWDERMPIYKKYASVTVDTEGKSIDEIVMEILTNLS